MDPRAFYLIKFILHTFLVTNLPFLLTGVVCRDFEEALDVSEQGLGGRHQSVGCGVHGHRRRRALWGVADRRRR